MQVNYNDGTKDVFRSQTNDQVQEVVDQVLDPASDVASVKIWKERDLTYKSGPYHENRHDRRADRVKNKKKQRA